MSTSEPSPVGGSVTLDQLIALNDELAALVRAGVPLERGLIEAGRDFRGRLGAITTRLGERMAEGLPLSEALAASRGEMPDVYQAVVEAGVRSGRLSEALEGMAAIARGYSDARRAVGMAMLYPLIVVGLAYSLAVVFVIQIAPRFVSAFQSLGIPSIRALEALNFLGESALYWAPIPPLLFALAAYRWARSSRSIVLDGGKFAPMLNRLPWIGSMIRSFRASHFAGLLALMIEHGVPLDQAVRLAGRASGDPGLRASADRLAESIRRGEGPLEVNSTTPSELPPLLSWMLTAGHRQGDLAEALKHLALTYQRRASGRADYLKLALPSLCMLGIGVGSVAIYALMIFIPLAKLWDELTVPVNH